MNKELERAKEILETEKETTFVAISPTGEIYRSSEMGIVPITDLIDSRKDFLQNAYVADKVIGRAAAFLLARGKICGLYTKTVSHLAKQVIDMNGIPFFFEEEVEFIKNRRKTGMCPMEQAVLHVHEKEWEHAYWILRQTQKEMRG